MKVSIITVCFNSERTIEDTIQSVLQQDYHDIEYIIIDGKSTDSTLGIIDKYSDRIATVVSEPDKGIYDAMNKGISLANGELIGILNSDDFYPRNTVISEVVFEKKKNIECKILLGNVNFIRPDGTTKIVRHYSSFKFRPWKMRFGFMPAHPASFIDKEVYEVVGRYSNEYKIASDFDFFAKCFLCHRYCFNTVDKDWVHMREGGVSTAGIKSYWLTTNEQAKALKNNNIISNRFFLLMRLPIKFFLKYFRN